MPVLDTGIFFAGRQEDARIKSEHDGRLGACPAPEQSTSSVMPVLDTGILLPAARKGRGSGPRVVAR